MANIFVMATNVAGCITADLRASFIPLVKRSIFPECCFVIHGEPAEIIAREISVSPPALTDWFYILWVYVFFHR